jgi:hypothetical protein
LTTKTPAPHGRFHFVGVSPHAPSMVGDRSEYPVSQNTS